MKELTINKNTNINIIKNKEEYEKLIINTKVYPFMLKGFKNVKELTIKRDRNGFNVYNETHINDLPFKDNIEKLIFVDIKVYGKPKNRKSCSYELELPNLKSIEFIGGINWYNPHYLYYCSKLKEIIINAENYINTKFYLGNDTLESFVLKNKDKEYKFDLEYYPLQINIEASTINNAFKINYETNGINSEINKDEAPKHTLNYYSGFMLENKNVSIPDYITNINSNTNLCGAIKEIECLFFNIKLLKNQETRKKLLDGGKLNRLENVILRSNNNMSLFPNIIIDIKEYGNVEDIYIENKKLYITYNNLVITIDEFGKKIIKKLEIENKDENDIEDYFKIYKVDELENYLYYKKLLENLKDDNDIEFKNAMNIVGDRIIKKLTRK